MRMDSATMGATSLLATRIAFGSAVIALALLAIVHVVRPDIDPLHQMISEYALGPHGWLMTLCFVSFAIAGAGLAVALLTNVPDGRTWLFWASVLLLFVAAAGPALAAVFPSDPSSTPTPLMSHSGKMHGLSFMVGVPGELLSMLLLTVFFRRRKSSYGRLMLALTIGAWASVILLGVAMIVIVGRHHFDPGLVGLTNRLFMVAYGAWVATVVRALPGKCLITL